MKLHSRPPCPSSWNPVAIPTGDTDRRPITELKERHHRWRVYYLKAMPSCYSIAEVQTDHDLIRFFRKAWDHPSRELMCKIVANQTFESLPARLTSKRIWKHFLHCEACPSHKMAQNPIPRTALDKVIVPGEEFQVDSVTGVSVMLPSSSISYSGRDGDGAVGPMIL